MNWSTALKSFQDELEKIGVSLTGISSDTLLNYPKAQPMATPAVEKAQRVLDKIPSIKTAAAGPPDQLPELGRLYRKSKRKNADPPPGKIDAVKNIGGHTLAGAGAGKFVTDWVTRSNASNKQRFIGMSVGGALGAAEYARKKIRKKHWQEGK